MYDPQVLFKSMYSRDENSARLSMLRLRSSQKLDPNRGMSAVHTLYTAGDKAYIALAFMRLIHWVGYVFEGK